jgi:hypothetical protein
VQRICGDAACEPALVPASLYSEKKIETQEEASWSPSVVNKTPIADVERGQERCSQLFSRTSTKLLESLKSLRTMLTNAQGEPAQIATSYTRFNSSNTPFFSREEIIEGRAASAVYRDSMRLRNAIKPPLDYTPESPVVIVSDKGRKRKLSSLDAVAPGPIPAQYEIGETSGRRIKRSKDMPRRPISAYNLFSGRSEMQSQTPEQHEVWLLGTEMCPELWATAGSNFLTKKPVHSRMKLQENKLYRRASSAYLRI